MIIISDELFDIEDLSIHNVIACKICLTGYMNFI